MCGRYVNAKARGDLLSYYDAVEGSDQQTAPSWNIAPTQAEPIITERLEEGGVVEGRLLTTRWGMVPSFSALLILRNYCRAFQLGQSS
ncbi:SOS response-associated peptidase family protein [Arthrobacter sp. M4]|uniref:SOS response-associated peptidase family protein n=1 Tax=Arthrobacter sp. M4 TaxID=218160 RepID=UPI001CDCD417|nr:SOS response-associated peptidase family protein [Arthrobacter sp. M4]MCA4135647.1 SOS response-associated peptidase [Arthrobacter sp. M4]